VTTTLDFTPNCMTTAMGIMPHRDVDKALELALSLDVPFWPQLPNVSYYEDMYAQVSEHFPGITIDPEVQKVTFDTADFAGGIVAYSEKMLDDATFELSPQYSKVFHRFLAQDLSSYPAIRGQVTGPVSFGFRVTDENDRPLVYNDEVRTMFFDFVQRKLNVQYRQLREKNPNAFVWTDEPGLGWVFSGLSGYLDTAARKDYREFMAGSEGPGGLHLCAAVNLPYLLELGEDILSFDAFQMEVLPRDYAAAVDSFIERDGIIAWGIVPSDSVGLSQHSAVTLADHILGYWQVVADETDLTVRDIAARSLLAPARCCLRNIGPTDGSAAFPMVSGEACDLSDEERVVEQAFDVLKELSARLRDKLDL
jgi:hypothetical protein